MKKLFLFLLFVPGLAISQTVTILPTEAMISASPEYVSLGESSYAILSPNRHSESELAVIRYRQAPDKEIGFHLHYDTDEFFYVISGKMTMTIRDSTFTAGPGTFIHIPPGTPHAHGNQSGEMNELLLMYTSGKMADLFRAWGNLVKGGTTDPDQLQKKLLDLPEEYDVEFITP